MMMNDADGVQRPWWLCVRCKGQVQQWTSSSTAFTRCRWIIEELAARGTPSRAVRPVLQQRLAVAEADIILKSRASRSSVHR
jgi:hypothetical protein